MPVKRASPRPRCLAQSVGLHSKSKRAARKPPSRHRTRARHSLRVLTSQTSRRAIRSSMLASQSRPIRRAHRPTGIVLLRRSSARHPIGVPARISPDPAKGPFRRLRPTFNGVTERVTIRDDGAQHSLAGVFVHFRGGGYQAASSDFSASTRSASAAMAPTS
jgi:hypothetical protein